MKRLLSRFPNFPSLVVLLLSCPAYFLAYQANPTRHFGIGRWDSPFLADKEKFYPPVRMSGPLRHPDGTVEVQDFVGRLTKRDASFGIPYHAMRTPLQFRLRCHRFGLQGTVVLAVNGHHIEDFSFTKQSYPWDGIRAVVPQEVAEAGPLRVDLVVLGGDSPPSHLPADLGLGVDWLEVTALSRGVILLPTAEEWLTLLLFLLFGYFFLRFLGTRPFPTAVAMITIGGLVCMMVVLYPAVASRALMFAWISFPLLMLVLWLTEFADRRVSPLARRETT